MDWKSFGSLTYLAPMEKEKFPMILCFQKARSDLFKKQTAL
jgi:hypothetical protein